ncbi:cupin domain-containing protein [Brevibacterium album]|uniref:cupin domain-containing protein n=1 Tax=Brevibacterium album TaxID=417948 RepID=UPI000686CFB2|nr:cupin domain-containing protein [Brevibacterium album]
MNDAVLAGTTPDGSGPGAAVLDVLALAPAADPERRNGRPSVKRLLQADGANLIAFTFAPGQSLPEHTAAHPITVQCLSGLLTFTCEGETTVLTPGTVVHCRAHVEHRVDCPEEPAGSVQEGGAAGPNVLLLTMLTGERH